MYFVQTWEYYVKIKSKLQVAFRALNLVSQNINHLQKEKNLQPEKSDTDEGFC